MLSLSLRMGIPVGELCRRMTMPELTEYLALAELEAGSEEWSDEMREARQEAEHTRMRRFFQLMGIKETTTWQD